MLFVVPMTINVAQAKTTLNQNLKKINKEFLKVFNKYRKENDLYKLKNNNSLVLAARVRSKQLVTFEFSHTLPGNKSLIKLCNEKGAKKYRIYGEIIAKIYCRKIDTVKNTRKLALMTIYDGWKNSPSHNKAMLSDEYSFCGTSYYYQDDKLYVCTIFAG